MRTSTSVERTPDAHTVAAGGRLDLGEADARHGQALGHAVRRVRGGVREQAERGAQQRRPNRRARRHDGADLRERGTVGGREAVGGAHHVGERGGRGEHERGVDRDRGVAERGGRERGGRGDVHVGHDRRDAHRRAVQRERGERGDEPVVGGDAVQLRRARRAVPRAGRACSARPSTVRWRRR